MSPEEEAQLRHLLRLERQLPQPISQLFRRTTKRFSRAGELLKGTDKQKTIASKKKDEAPQSGKKR